MDSDGQPAMSLLDQSGRHPLSVIMIFATLLLFGAVSFFNLKLEDLPEIPVPAVRVVCEFPGYPPDEIQQLITIPLENALSGVKGVKKISSLSKSGLSAVTLRFDWDVEIELAAIEVRETIDSVYPYLPQGVQKPVAFTESLSDRPVMILACVPREGIQMNKLYIDLKYDLKSQLQKIPDIARIEFIGLRKPEIQVDADMNALYSSGSSVPTLARYLGQFLIDYPAGKIQEGIKEQLVQISTGISTPQEIRELPIRLGSSLAIKDISSVKYGEEEAHSLFLYNGKPAAGIRIYKSGNSGTLQAARAVSDSLSGLNRTNKDLFSLEILDDASIQIIRSIRSLILSLVLGLTAAIIVLFYIYRGVTFPLITSLTIPLTIILVFFFMYLLGISLNTVSLLGMVIGIGLIADNNIIILEEFEKKDDLSAHQTGPLIRKISPAVLSSSLTTILVFVPPLLLPGVTGVLFRDLILTIILLITLSYVVSHFFSPACYVLSLPHKVKPTKPFWIRHMERTYKGILYRGIKMKRPKLFLVSFYLFIMGVLIGLALLMPVEILTPASTNELSAIINLPGDWNSDQIRKEGTWLSQQLQKQFSFTHTTVEAGYEPDSLREKSEPGRYMHRLNFHLYSNDSLSLGMNERVRNHLAGQGYPEAKVNPVMNTLEMALQESSEMENSGLQPILRFEPDRESISAAGLSAADIHRELGAIIQGALAGNVSYDREKISVRVRGKEEYRNSADSLAGLKLSLGESYIKLADLVSFEKTWEPRELIRINRGQVVENKAEFQAGVFLRLYLFALVLMYLVLGIQTASAKKAFILFLSLPVSLFGSLVLLFLTGYTLNLYSFIGILIMQGTILNTAILLLTGLKKGTKGELLSIAPDRIRPVLSTTLTTVFALVPVLYQSLHQGNATGGMAAAVIGGMLLGTPLILYFIPMASYYSTKK